MVLADYRPHLPQAIQIYCDDRTLSLTDWDGFRRPAPPGRGSWLTYFDEEYSQWLPSSPYHYACYLNSTIRAHSLATYREAPARIFLCPNLLRSLSTYWQYGNTVGRIIANDLKLNDLVQRMLAATLAHEIYHTVDCNVPPSHSVDKKQKKKKQAWGLSLNDVRVCIYRLGQEVSSRRLRTCRTGIREDHKVGGGESGGSFAKSR